MAWNDVLDPRTPIAGAGWVLIVRERAEGLACVVPGRHCTHIV